MEFKLNPNPTFSRDVELSTPEGVAKVPFTFKYKDKVELDAWFKTNKNTQTAKALCEVVESWRVLGDDNNPVDVTEDNMKRLFTKYQAAASEILTAYYDALKGSRAKNS